MLKSFEMTNLFLDHDHFNAVFLDNGADLPFQFVASFQLLVDQGLVSE
jgi:hypothetical protein